MSKKISKKNKPVLIVIAGPNGSGKTSITRQILKHEWIQDCVYINPDDIAQEKYGDWNSKRSILKAAKYAAKRRYKCLKNNESIIFETVFSSDEKIDYIKKAKDLGYFVRLFFIATDSPTINAERVAQRVLKGGHDVPITKIIARYAKSITNGALALTIVDPCICL